MEDPRNIKIKLKIFFAKIFRPFFFWLSKGFPNFFDKSIQQAGSLDYSAMQEHFNSVHQFFLKNSLSKIQFDKFDIERIRKASEESTLIYMMRNWGQIEYNFFNSLFLKEKLPLAAHANLIRMIWWMPLKSFFNKLIARLDFFYAHGKFPDSTQSEAITECLKTKQSPFVFLNLPILLNLNKSSQTDLIHPILQTASELPENENFTIIPLDFLYDRRPGKAKKSFIDIIFGEKENPGSLRKLVLFFRNHKKHAVAKMSEPIPVREFIKAHSQLPLTEQSRLLRNKLHHDFYEETLTVTGPALKSREAIIDLTLEDKTLREAFFKLSTELGKPMDQLYLESQVILEEIVADPNYTYLELWDLFLQWVFKNIYEGLVVDEAGLSRVKKYAKKYPLILVPSHRSHMDYLLLSDIFYQQKLSMPLVVAGTNLSFWPLGHFFRKSGAYFLRRSFGTDPLYPLLFKSYTKTLLREGYFQEFFIEGTRSRTGKSEAPRTGMLSLYLDCFLENTKEDFYFIPVSINYEKVLEEKSHAQEARGAYKEKESFWDLFKIVKYLNHKSGHVYVNFGEAISMKDFLHQRPLTTESDKRNAVSQLAHEISTHIEKVNVITAPNLLASALLSHNKKGQSFSEILERVNTYQKALELQNINLSPLYKADPLSALKQALARYEKQGIIETHFDGNENFYTLDANHRLQIDFYKNALMPHLAGISIGAWIALKFSHQFSRDEFTQFYQTLAPVFQCEFLSIPSFQESLNSLCSLETLSLMNEESFEIKNRKMLEYYADLLKNFMEAYQITLKALLSLQFVKWDEKTLLRKILEFGNTLYLKGDVEKPEALSQFLIKNAVHSFRDLCLILSHENEMGKNGRKIYSSKNSNTEIKYYLDLISQGELQSEEIRSFKSLSN